MNMEQYLETNYFVNSDGSVYCYYPTSRKNRFYKKKQQISNTGYLRVGMTINGKQSMKSVHRLVAELYLENPNKLPQVNHKDGDRLNNTIENLEWVTASQNTKHSFDVLMRKGKGAKGEKSGKSKLKYSDVEYIRKNYIPYNKEFSMMALSKKFGVADSTIHYVIHNKTWQ